MFNPSIQPIPPRFGWGGRHAAMPTQAQYEYALQAGDLTADRAPTQALVEQVADRLVEGNPKLGFVVLTNTLNLLGNAKNVRRFQAKLYEQVMRHIVTQAKAPRWLHWLSQQVANHLVQPSENPEDPLMNPEFISINGLRSPKDLHRDYAGKSLLVSLSYGINQGCKGGHPQLADIEQYEADTGLAAESLYTDQHIVLIDRHNKKIQQDGYVHTMSTLEMEHDIPIVMFDNRRLVHGATQVQPENYESRRLLGRILLTFSPWSQNSNYGPAKYPSNSTKWNIRSMAESAFFDPW